MRAIAATSAWPHRAHLRVRPIMSMKPKLTVRIGGGAYAAARLFVEDGFVSIEDANGHRHVWPGRGLDVEVEVGEPSVVLAGGGEPMPCPGGNPLGLNVE